MRKYLGIILNYYYLIAIALYFVTFFVNGFHVGFVCAGIMVVITLGIFFPKKGKWKISGISDYLCVAYMLWCVISSLQYFSQNISYTVFIKAASNSMLPICFYFVPKVFDTKKIWKNFLKAYFICALVGLILIVTKTDKFYSYCAQYGYSNTRLSSVIGSTAIGMLGVISIIVSIKEVCITKGEKGKLLYLSSIVFSFLSMQRSAWIVMALVLLLLHICIFYKWKILKISFFYVEMVIFFSGVIVFWNGLCAAINRYILERASAVSDGKEVGLFSSRVYTWIEAIKNSNIIIGSGYGARTHKAMGVTEYIVCDGSWAGLLCEIGIIGILIFIALIIINLVKGVKNFRLLYAQVMIVIAISLQAIGSNMLEYQIIMPLFWLSLGEINMKEIGKGIIRDESNCNVSSTVSYDSGE